MCKSYFQIFSSIRKMLISQLLLQDGSFRMLTCLLRFGGVVLSGCGLVSLYREHCRLHSITVHWYMLIMLFIQAVWFY